MSFSSIGKKFGQFKQWTGEKLGNTSHTDKSDDVKALEDDTERRKEGIEKTHMALLAYIKQLDRKKVSKVDPTKGKHVPLETLGQALMYQGRLLDQQDLFIKMGETERQLGEYQMEYVQKLKSCFLVHMEVLVESLKDYQQIKKKLHMRRLDYDAKLNRMQKSKKEKPEHEEELQASLLKYESSLQDLKNIMWMIQEKQAQVASYMKQTMMMQRDYHQQSFNELNASLSGLPEMSLPEIPAEKASLRSSRTSTLEGGTLPSYTSSLMTTSASKSQSASMTGSNSAGLGAATVTNGFIKSGQLETAASSISSLSLSEATTTASLRSSSVLVLKKAKAVFPFKGENDDELSMAKGDTLDILEMVDDGWWVARNEKGAIGMIPSNYVEAFQQEQDNQEAKNQGPKIMPRKGSNGSLNSAGSTIGDKTISSIRPSSISNGLGELANKQPVDANIAAKCRDCSCDDFSPNVFKAGSCNNCFHKH